jgi:hypothetical protein
MRMRGWDHIEWWLTRKRWEVIHSSNMRSSRRRSPGSLLRPGLAPGRDAENVDADHPHLSYDDEKFRQKLPPTADEHHISRVTDGE